MVQYNIMGNIYITGIYILRIGYFRGGFGTGGKAEVPAKPLRSMTETNRVVRPRFR